MDNGAIIETLEFLCADHKIIAAEMSRLQTAIKGHNGDAQKEVIKFKRMLSDHFFCEDLELFPVIVRFLYLADNRNTGVRIFESDEERKLREQTYVPEEYKKKLWKSAYDDRGARSELISFAKITFQVFMILDEYIQKRTDLKTRNSRVLGVIHILEARIEYEEEELFPKIRQLVGARMNVGDIKTKGFL